MDNHGLTDRLSFTGSSKAECQQFIRDVRGLAFKAGKSRDDEWMADLAAASMMDNAVGWHVSLDDAVQGSWALLQKALVEKYIDGADYLSSSNLSSAAQMPTPARIENAAARPPPALIAPNVITRIGNIALIDSSCSTVNRPFDKWITDELGTTGMLKWTPNKYKAAAVRCSPLLGESHDIHMVNSVRSPAYLALTCVKLSGKDQDRHASPHDAALTLAASGFDAGSVSSSYLLPAAGYTTSSIWTIDSQGFITAKVTGTAPRFEFGVNNQTRNICAPISISEWKLRSSVNAPNMVSMKLVFVDL